MNTLKLLSAAFLLSAMTGCAGVARQAASPAASGPASSTATSEVVVFVAGRDGLPGKVAITAVDELDRGELSNAVELRKDSFVAYPVVGKQRVMVPWSGSAIDVEVGASERVYLRLTFQKGRYVFERVRSAEAQPVVAKLTAESNLSL